VASTEKWQEGLPKEVAFWDNWLAGKTKYAEDRALRLSAELLMQGLRAYDVVGRWTHDLFVVLIKKIEVF